MKILKRRIIFLTILGIIFILALIIRFSGKFILDNNTFTIRESDCKIKVQLKKSAEGKYLLDAYSFKKGQLIQKNSWPFEYEVFKLDTGDVNNDGTTDILVGVIKRTRFDTVCRKRLFIFKLVEGYIRPLWLGSRVSQPLEDFKFYQGKPYGIIRTIELEKDMSYLVADYKWQGFGLAFIRYVSKEISYKQAKKLLNTNQYEINR